MREERLRRVGGVGPADDDAAAAAADSQGLDRRTVNAAFEFFDLVMGDALRTAGADDAEASDSAAGADFSGDDYDCDDPATDSGLGGSDGGNGGGRRVDDDDDDEVVCVEITGSGSSSCLASDGGSRDQASTGSTGLHTVGDGTVSAVSGHPGGKTVEERLVTWIKADRKLYERLLLFETVNLHAFYRDAQAAGIVCSKVAFRAFLDAQGVNFTSTRR
eukprot:g4735.t1